MFVSLVRNMLNGERIDLKINGISGHSYYY